MASSVTSQHVRYRALLGILVGVAALALALLPGRALADPLTLADDPFAFADVAAQPQPISEGGSAPSASVPAPEAPITSAQELAAAFNATAPEGTSYAEVSEDASTVTLLASLVVEGDSAFEIALPAGQNLTLAIGGQTLAFENDGAELPAQLFLSGEGTLAITADGGGILSKTADGTLPAVLVAAGNLEIACPLTVETPADHIAAVRVYGGALTLESGARVIGSTINSTALVGVIEGSFTLNGGTIACAGDEESTALTAVGGTLSLDQGIIVGAGGQASTMLIGGAAVCTISGAWISGDVECSENGSLTISGGIFTGGLYCAESSTLRVTAGQSGYSAIFSAPVPVQYLSGIAAVITSFDEAESTTAFTYFANAANAETFAAGAANTRWATVGEDGYVCYFGFAASAETAAAQFQSFMKAIGAGGSVTFEGPTLMDFIIKRPNTVYTITLKDATGTVIDSVIDDRATDAVLSFINENVDLPGTENPEYPVIGSGAYTTELSSAATPPSVFSVAPLAISQVTYDFNGGAVGEATESVTYQQQGPETVDALPVRPGYRLAGWTAEPDTIELSLDEDTGQWSYVLPDTPETVTVTAQWEPDVVMVYRLWNPYNGAHLLTTDAGEVASLSAGGWVDESEVFSVYGSAYPDSTPVTRVYNPYNGDHLYSTSAAEVAELVGYGWQDEGVKFYGAPTEEFPVYRLWNSLQTGDGGLGSHLWTADQTEYDTLPQLPPVGAWQQEGAVWYAVSLPEK